MSSLHTEMQQAAYNLELSAGCLVLYWLRLAVTKQLYSVTVLRIQNSLRKEIYTSFVLVLNIRDMYKSNRNRANT